MLIIHRSELSHWYRGNICNARVWYCIMVCCHSQQTPNYIPQNLFSPSLAFNPQTTELNQRLNKILGMPLCIRKFLTCSLHIMIFFHHSITMHTVTRNPNEFSAQFKSEAIIFSCFELSIFYIRVASEWAHVNFDFVNWTSDWCYAGSHAMCSIILHMMTSSNGSIFRVTGHLCGEFTGPRWNHRTKASDAELWCFFICF